MVHPPLSLLIIHGPEADSATTTAQHLGHQIQQASDGQQALTWLGNSRLDLLLAPLEQVSGQLTWTSQEFGVPLWLLASSEQLASLSDLSGLDDILPRPFSNLLFEKKLNRLSQSLEQRKRLIQLENLLRENTALDPLTQLPNRYFGVQNVRLQWQRFRRKGIPFGCLLISLIDFKQFNQANGLRRGDERLCAAAEFLRSKVRGSDLICRYHGQQFLVICSDTDLEGVQGLVRRLQASSPFEANFACLQAEPGLNSPDELLHKLEQGT